MFSSFGSALWMMPFSKHCRTENVYLKHFSAWNKKGHQAYHCDDHEFQINYSGWPTNVVNIEIPTTRGAEYSLMHHSVIVAFTSLKCIWIMLMHASALAGDEAYPSFIGAAPVNLSDMDYAFPTHQSFTAREVSDGTFFKSISDYDPDSQRLLYQLEE